MTNMNHVSTLQNALHEAIENLDAHCQLYTGDLPLRVEKGYRTDLDDLFSIQHDRHIIHFAIQPENCKNVRSVSKCWQLLKNEKFENDENITAKLLFQRVQQLCRSRREDYLWLLLTYSEIKPSETSDAYKIIEQTISYLKYFILKAEEDRPALPYPSQPIFEESQEELG